MLDAIRGPRGVTFGLVVSVAFVAAGAQRDETPEPVPSLAAFHYVPLVGSAVLEDAQDAGDCSSSVDVLLDHPNAQLVFQTGQSYCGNGPSWGTTVRIDASGRAVISRYGSFVEHHTQLTPDERDAVMHLDDLSCAEDKESPYRDWIGVGVIGEPAIDGARIWSASPLGRRIDPIVHRIINRAYNARYDELKTWTFELRAPSGNRIRMRGTRLRVYARDGRVLHDELVFGESFIDLADRLREAPLEPDAIAERIYIERDLAPLTDAWRIAVGD